MKDSPDILPQSTLMSVEDFITSHTYPASVQIASRHVPKYTVDGYGKWKEVNNQGKNDMEKKRIDGLLEAYRSSYLYNDATRPDSNSGSSVPQSSHLQRNDSRSESLSVFSEQTRPPTDGSFQSYKHLSTSLRSNVFPGMGKEKWESSSKKAFVPKFVSSSRPGTNENFGVKKDAYMKWAEHDVYRQRLMKAWDKYISEAPKVERPAPVKVVKEKKNKVLVKADIKKKAKTKKEMKTPQPAENKSSRLATTEVQPTRIEVKPAKSDENFWEFYDEPFAQS